MPYAIRVHQFGGPEQMRWEQVDPGKPGPGEVLVRNTAVGLMVMGIFIGMGIAMGLVIGLGLVGLLALRRRK